MICIWRNSIHTCVLATTTAEIEILSKIEIGAETLTLGALLEFTKSHKLHQYRFNETGNGCFHWNRVLFATLGNFGYVQDGVDEVFARVAAEMKKENNQGCKWQFRRMGCSADAAHSVETTSTQICYITVLETASHVNNRKIAVCDERPPLQCTDIPYVQPSHIFSCCQRGYRPVNELCFFVRRIILDSSAYDSYAKCGPVTKGRRTSQESGALEMRAIRAAVTNSNHIGK